MNLPEAFRARMQTELGGGYDDFIASYNRPAERAIRVNTLKISSEQFEKISPLGLDGAVPWASGGYFVRGENLGKTVEHAAGLYYVQEPSAMAPVSAMDIRAGERVLDLCSAPGGKGTQIAQYLGGTGIVFMNEINSSRAKILSENVERLGVKNAVVTCAAPETLAFGFESYFDKILVDAPCSGEGMFKKEEAAAREWSVKSVISCAERQSRILDCADKMLAEGGRLTYSTCTFSRQEDEEQIENFLKTHKNYRLIQMQKLMPHETRGEGQFFAVLEKLDGARRDLPLLKPVADKTSRTIFEKWAAETLFVNFSNVHNVNGVLYSLPPDMPVVSAHMLRAGIRLGTVKDGRFEPSHSLAMCLSGGESERIETDKEQALAFLRGYTLTCGENIKGWRLVTYNGYPLGWSKVSGGTAKNHLPKGLRI